MLLVVRTARSWPHKLRRVPLTLSASSTGTHLFWDEKFGKFRKIWKVHPENLESSSGKFGKLRQIRKVGKAYPENSESSSGKFGKSSQIRKVSKVRHKKKRSSHILG